MSVLIDPSPAEVHDLRQRVSTAHTRRGVTFKHPEWITYVDGPLAGITHPMERSHDVRLGWCLVLIYGPVVAMYEPTTDRRVWRFAGWEAPGIL